MWHGIFASWPQSRVLFFVWKLIAPTRQTYSFALRRAWDATLFLAFMTTCQFLLTGKRAENLDVVSSCNPALNRSFVLLAVCESTCYLLKVQEFITFDRKRNLCALFVTGLSTTLPAPMFTVKCLLAIFVTNQPVRLKIVSKSKVG